MKRSSLAWGVLLVLAGLYALSLQWLYITKASIVLFLGIAFFAVYLVTRRTGWVIPAMLLACIGGGILLIQYRMVPLPDAVLMITMIALAFFLMHPFVFRRQGHWPLFPGFVLLAMAVLVYMTQSPFVARLVWGFVSDYWPIALIIFGVWIMLAQFLRPRHRTQPEQVHAAPAPVQAESWGEGPSRYEDSAFSPIEDPQPADEIPLYEEPADESPAEPSAASPVIELPATPSEQPVNQPEESQPREMSI